MSDLSEQQKQTLREILPQIEAVVLLAKANFPRTGDVRIETSGASPNASINVPWYIVKHMVDAALQAMGDRRG